MYLGTDIEEISRFRSLIERRPKLLRRIFFDSEWSYAQCRASSAATLTGIWCAKEAIVKAFSPKLNLQISQVEILNRENNFPLVKIHHPHILDYNYELSLSISHARGVAVAVAILHVIQELNRAN